MKRNKAAQVLVHVVAMPNLLQRADNGEANPIQQDGCADRRSSGKKRPPDLIADDNDGALLQVVQFIDPAPLARIIAPIY